MPRFPALVNLPASVKMPDLSVEKARSPFPVVKFCVKIPVMAAVEVAFTRSLVRNESRDADEVADARLERYSWSAVAPDEVLTISTLV